MAIIGDALSVLALKAKIHVTTMPYATVNFIKGGSTQATMTANASGNCDYEILVPNFGTWTVSASGGGGSGSSSVSVSDTITYNTTVTITRYFIANGNWVSGVGHNKAGSGYIEFYDDGDYILLKTYQGGSNEIGSGYITPAVSFGYWKRLYIGSRETGDHAYAGIATDNSSNPPNFSAYVELCGRRDTLTDPHESYVDVSGISGSRYLALQTKAWITQTIPAHGTGGQILIWNMWLST